MNIPRHDLRNSYRCQDEYLKRFGRFTLPQGSTPPERAVNVKRSFWIARRALKRLRALLGALKRNLEAFWGFQTVRHAAFCLAFAAAFIAILRILPKFTP